MKYKVKIEFEFDFIPKDEDDYRCNRCPKRGYEGHCTIQEFYYRSPRNQLTTCPAVEQEETT
jgi:hypothetical protein